VRSFAVSIQTDQFKVPEIDRACSTLGRDKKHKFCSGRVKNYLEGLVADGIITSDWILNKNL
jgi:hypothetical protein